MYKAQRNLGHVQNEHPGTYGGKKIALTLCFLEDTAISDHHEVSARPKLRSPEMNALVDVQQSLQRLCV